MGAETHSRLLVVLLLPLAWLSVLEYQNPERVVIYLHGRIVEEKGRRPVDSAFGVYEYDAILDSLRSTGATVLSDHRPPAVPIDRFVTRLIEQVDSLQRRGVPAKHITIVGFSRGSAIAMLASSRMQNPEIGFVFMAACEDWAFGDPNLRVTGRILSLHETSDPLGVSCGPLFQRKGAGSVVRELPLSLGLGHGTFYRPHPEWIDPVRLWIR